MRNTAGARRLGWALCYALIAVLVHASPVAAAQLPAVTVPLTCAAGSTYTEARDWWTPTGVSFNEYRGIDGGICLPSGVVSGTFTTTLHLGLRHNPATISEIRVYLCDAAHSGGVLVYHNTSALLTGTSSTNVRRDITISFNSQAIGSGWKELRVQTRVGSDSDNHVLAFATTGWQLQVVNGATHYRPLNWTEVRAWYRDGPYVHERFLSALPVTPRSGIWGFTVGFPEGHSHVYVDADTFADPMVFPLTLACTTTCSLDTRLLANGQHYLLLRSDHAQTGGTSSGLELIAFTVANP